jgi:hypothetical protein
MNRHGYVKIGSAKTLEQLQKLIEEAVEFCGKDASWNGYDDGNIYIHSKDRNRYAYIHQIDRNPREKP